MTTQTETERKYDVADDARVPDLSGLDAVGVATLATPHEYELDAEYFDTATGALAARRITLRRRRGGSDDGWHIKLPGADGRTELHWPLDTGASDESSESSASDESSESVVPGQVLGPVRGVVRDHPLALIAKLTTRRTITRLLGDDGGELVEIADDVVTASDPASGIVRIWREWEAELLDGASTDPGVRSTLLDAVEERLRAAGARPAASASKLASALGRTSLDTPGRPRLVSKHGAAVDVLGAVMESLVAELGRWDAAVRRDDPDAVHAFRTRIRRIRSLLKSYRAVYEPAATAPIEEELKHLGSVFATARDAEVMVARATAIVEDHEQVSRSVLGSLTDHWSAEREVGLRLIAAELDGKRYFRLLDALDDLVARPPLGPRATQPAAAVLSAALDRDLRRVIRAGRKADAASSAGERIELLHDTRKAAKRLRYAAEAVSSGEAAILGKRTRALGGAAEAVHDLLGEHRDSGMMQEYLRRSAGDSGHAFDFGVLHELERLSSAMCLEEYRTAMSALRKLRP